MPLLPVSHIGQQAHIMVTLSGEGEFLGAEFLGKAQIVIPATEESAGRTSDAAAHPLADKLHYCAADYKGEKENRFALYEAGLADWCASAHAHPKARAVLAYVRKGRLTRDLVRCGVLQADAAGELLTGPPETDPAPLFKVLTPKKQGGKTIRDQGGALICWRVETPGDHAANTWEDPSLQQAWMNYDAAAETQEAALCMVSGDFLPLADKHPRDIRWPGDKAKLVSVNDGKGFTFRGKFEKALEASSVGYTVSHMAHSALRWLIARQGYRNGEQVVVAWAVKGETIPEPLNDTWLQEPNSVTAAESAPEEMHCAEGTPACDETSAPPDHTRDLGFSFARRLRGALAGYATKLQPTDDIVILGLDAATPGRLSVTFYRELSWSQYLERLALWQEQFSWILHRTPTREQKGKRSTSTIWQVAAPRPEEICFAAYGGRADDKLERATVERLLPCIADAAPLPWDLLESCVRRSCNRAGLKRGEWQAISRITCGLYKGFYARHPLPGERRMYSMALDETITSRDYLFGRLFAVAEYAERSALEAAEEKRQTNAERLMQRFADHPCPTWLTLEKQLNPYMTRLQSNEKTRATYFRCKKLLQSICDLFAPNDFTSPSRLSGEFLLGYHCQMSAFYKKQSPAEPQTALEGENA